MIPERLKFWKREPAPAARVVREIMTPFKAPPGVIYSEEHYERRRQARHQRLLRKRGA